MSRSDRRKQLKPGLTAGIAISVLLSVGFIGFGLSESAEYRRQADYQTTEYSADTYKKITETCVRMTPVQQAQCVNDASHERRANERDEQDLVAQKRSALWAYIMGAAAVIGMCLSVVGVYLVYTTFQATREANKIGQDALMAEHRPRIVIRRVDFKQCERGIYGSFTATNIGGSDAIFHAAGCWIYCIKGPLPAIPPYEGKYRTYAGNILPLRAQPKSSRVRPRGAKMNSGDWMKFHFIAREFIEINNQDGYSYGPRYYIMGWVDYRQASGNYVRRTSFCREIGDGPSTTLKAVENADYEHQD